MTVFNHEGDGENTEHLQSMDLHDVKTALEKDAELDEVMLLNVHCWGAEILYCMCVERGVVTNKLCMFTKCEGVVLCRRLDHCLVAMVSGNRVEECPL